MAKLVTTTYIEPEKKKTVHSTSVNKNTGNPLDYIVKKIGIGAAGVLEGIGDVFEGGWAWLSGNENYAKYVFQKSTVGEWRKDLDEEFNPDEFLSFLGAAGEGIGQSSTFLLNAAMPYLGTGMFFTGVVGNSIGSAVQQTGNLGWEEVGYGMSIGAAEAALESLIGAGSKAVKTIATKGATTVTKSLGKAVTGRAARNAIWKNILSASGGEFLEEFAGDFVDVGMQRAWQINPNAEYSISNALYSGLVGAVSGAAMGGTVELTNASHYISAGNRVIRNGNVALLLDEANAVADAFGTMGSGKGRTRMNQFIASVQGSVDAYNKLSEEGKQGVRGALYLGEMQGALFGLQSTRGVMIAAEQIKEKPEKFADYATKATGKTYTAQDVLDNKDGILDALAVRKFAGEFMMPAEAEQEIQAKMAEERRTATAAPAGAVMEEMGDPFEEMGDPFEEMGDPFEEDLSSVAVRPIEESAEWGGETATFAGEDGTQVTVLASEDGTYDLYLGEIDAENPDVNRLEGLTRKQVETILRESGEAIDVNSNEAEAVIEDNSEKSANNAEKSEESEELSEESQTSEEAVTDETEEVKKEVKSEEVKEEEKQVGEEASEDMSAEKKRSHSVEVAAIQDRARKAVPDFDQQSAEVRYAIEQMYRSADEMGVAADVADAAAHLIAVLGDVEIRFDKALAQNGVIMPLSDGRKLIAISADTDAEGGATTTLLHEVTHYIEGREGYEKLAKLAMEQYSEEKSEAIRERYRKYAEAHGLDLDEDYINEEVVAEAVGELLSKGKYIARLRNRSILVNAARRLWGYVGALKGKNVDAYRAALRLQDAMNHCLARTKEEAAEVVKRYAVAYTTNNRPVAIIEENILDGVPKSQWVKIVKKTLSEKFSAGIPVSGRLIKVNQNTRNEYTYSKNSQYYRDNDGTIYEDKFRSAGNLDDIVLASTNYINEDLNHRRKDNFTDFARGDVLIRVDGRDYSAKVIVGFTTGKEMVLYDVIDFERTAFETKKAGTRISQLHNAETDSSRVPENSSEGQVLNMESDDSPQPTSEVPVDGNATTNISIPQSDGVVKGAEKKYSLRKEETAEERKNTRPDIDRTDVVFADGGVAMSRELPVEAITTSDKVTLKSIGRKHVNEFDSVDIKQSVKWANVFWNDLKVKSPFFRAWFGDWRAYSTAPVNVVTVSSDTRGLKKNKDTGWDINRSAKVSWERHNSAASVAGRTYMPYIDGIIENAILLDSAISDKDSPHSLFYHYMYAVVDDGTGKHVVKLTVEEILNPGKETERRAYKLIDIEKYQPSAGVSQNNSLNSSLKAGTINTIADLFAFVKGYDNGFSPHSVNSLLLNEDGTPKVMYHGTRAENGEFWEFDYNKAKRKGGLGFKALGQGNYFTSQKLDGTEIYGSRVIEAYLSIKKPFVVEAGKGIDFRTHVTEALGINATQMTYPSIQKAMRAEGYDGVIQLNADGEIAIAVTFDSSQIKSATGNIGTFDGTNPDIRYSLRKEETDAERADRLDVEAKREKARADRLQAELHSYQEYGFNAGDVYAVANERMKGYKGGTDKNVLRKMLLKVADSIAYLRKNPTRENAAKVEANVDKDIREIADELTYHQAEEIDPELKEMRSYMRSIRVSISEDLKGDLDRFGGYETFRRQNMGRGLILSKNGVPVETIYPELTERFGEAAFPSSVKNPVDQLIQISDTLREGTLKAGEFVDLHAIAEAEAKLIRSELEAVVDAALMKRKEYNPVWNERTANGMNGEVVTYYTPEAAGRIMRSADDTVKAWAEQNGAVKSFRAGLRERVENEFLYRLNTDKPSDRRSTAERLAADLMQAQDYLAGAEKVPAVNKKGKAYTKYVGGEKYTVKEIPGADARALFDELVELILREANLAENISEGVKYARVIAAENAGLKDEIESLKAQAALASKIKSLSDLAKGKTKPSERVSLDEMNAVIENFSKIVYKGRISAKRTQEFILWLNGYLASKEPTGTISYLRESLSDGVLDTLTEFATSADGKDVEAGALGMFELKALNDLFYEIRHAYDNYGMVKLDGVWKDAFEVASKGVTDAKGSPLHLNKRKTLLQKFSRQVAQFFLQSQDPLRTAMMLEGYAEGGVLSKLIYDVIVGEAMKTSMQMEFLTPFEDFFKAHKGYQQKLAAKIIDTETFGKITLGEAMSLIGLSKREQAKAGLANSDIFFANDEEGVRRVEGGWKRWADMDTDQRISMLTGGISELTKKLEKEDLEFFDLVESFFNKVSTETKKRSDMDYFGHEMTMEEYYFPIYRDRATIAEEIADAAKRMQSFITVSNQSFNKQVMKNAEKSLFVANVYDVVTNHAVGLATYASLYRPVLNFNTIWNQQTSGNKNSPESMRSYYKQYVWEGTDAYMRNLFDQVQGITAPKGPLSKLFSTVRGNAVFFQLGLNPKTWLTQWTSIIASLDVLSVGSVQYGLGAGRKANDETMDKYSLFARTRDYNMEVVKAEGAGDKIHKVGEKTMLPISWMDRNVVRKLWAACQKEVETREGFAIGSEENNVAAGKLLDEVILRTQQTAGMATKSGLMRGSELEKSLTMFSSDAMKQLSSMVERVMRYQKYRADVKKGVPGAEEKLAESKRALAKTGGAVIGVAIASAIIAQIFKGFYDRDRRKKADGTEMNVIEDAAVDSFGNMVGVLPIVRDVYDMIDSGYEVSDFTLDAFNTMIEAYINVIDDAKRMVAGEHVAQEDHASNVRGLIYSAGMMLGLPTRNVNNLLEGSLNTVSDEWHWSYTSLFRKPTYQKDLDEAIEKGDTALAELIIETWLKREKVGAVGDELDILMDLYVKGYDILPSSVPSKLSAKQRKEWMAGMEAAQSDVADMILSGTWQALPEEAKAEAIKKLYRNHKGALDTSVRGKEPYRGTVLSEWYGYIPVAEISGMAAATEAYKDENGREVTRREQIDKVLSQYEGDEEILRYLAGYSTKAAKRMIAARIAETASGEEELAELYELFNIDPEEL